MINIKGSCRTKSLSQVGTGIKTCYEYSINRVKKIIFSLVFRQSREILFTR